MNDQPQPITRIVEHDCRVFEYQASVLSATEKPGIYRWKMTAKQLSGEPLTNEEWDQVLNRFMTECLAADLPVFNPRIVGK